MRLLELFSGSKSVSKAVNHIYDDIISVDILDKYNPTIAIDILNWNYKEYASGYFDAIWASPPCCEFSCLNHSRPDKTPNLQLANAIVKRTLEIIEYFKPAKWFIENPQTGSLKTMDYMKDIPYIDIDYCRFSNWGYRKRTRIWTNQSLETALCQGKGNCPNMADGRHKNALGNGTYKEFWVRGTDRQLQRYAIPADAIKYLFQI
jgi:hypothetical protein